MTGTEPRSPEFWDSARADEIIRARADGQGSLLPILHDLQHTFGHVPEAALPMIAATLNLSRAEVYGVFSFYHDFRKRPPGRHVVKLCRAEACQAAGGDALAADVQARLGLGFGETSPDGQVTLDAVYCLGLCACAPAAMIDGRLIGRLDAARADALVAEARR